MEKYLLFLDGIYQSFDVIFILLNDLTNHAQNTWAKSFKVEGSRYRPQGMKTIEYMINTLLLMAWIKCCYQLIWRKAMIKHYLWCS